jgi:hypothetical protein
MRQIKISTFTTQNNKKIEEVFINTPESNSFHFRMTLLQRYCKRRVIGVFLYLETKKYRYMSTPPTTQHKDKYKIKNWQAYNKSLQGISASMVFNVL